MLDLTTTFLGFELQHPLISGAGPLASTFDGVRRIEDAGAAAIILHSLFEEQIVAESIAAHRATDTHANTFGEALSYLPTPEDYALGPQEYVAHVQRCAEAVDVPLIASLNGVTLGRWIEYARQIEQAGADALELNVFRVPTSGGESAAQVEERVIELAGAVRAAVRIPIAIKLGPFYSALAHFAAQLERAGVNGLVIFNRFYEPDIDIDALAHTQTLQLSTSAELLLRLRWLAILSAQVRVSLAVTGGVHTARDVIKAVMAGAHGVQVVSALLQDGLGQINALLSDVHESLEEHEYQSLRQMHGSMNLLRCPDPAAIERGNYIHMLQTWQG